MNVKKLFEEKGALLKGHFILSSGLHSEYYLQSAKLLQYPDIATQLGKELASQFSKIPVDVVISPALGGIYVSHEVARALNVRSIFLERVDGALKLRRGFEIKAGEKVLVVEDIVTTGKSTREVLDVVKSFGGKVAGVGCLVDRSTTAQEFGAPFKSLLQFQIETYSENNCPEHLKKVPAEKPGSRKQ
jgi:orotate phosphoribosyltransferase